MRVEFTSQGIYLPEIDLWLDPQEGQAWAWISHAHSDHARGVHGHVIGTPASLEIYRLRWPVSAQAPQASLPLSYGSTLELRGARLTCLPAAHILGSAALLVEYGGERLIYTGDIKLRLPLCGAETALPCCDRLIIESTFGLPLFHFLDADAAQRQILDAAREALEQGLTPVFAGYPLGRGQEIAHVLTQGGIPTVVHGQIARFIPLYEQYGFQFPGWERYRAGLLEGRAVVIPSSFCRSLEAASDRLHFIYVSGWAALERSRKRVGVQELIPYSDHADYEELLKLVELMSPAQVDIVHGYSEELARMLRRHGYNAVARPQAMRAAAAEE
jgi:Cft2 family RNA processing exonuclease